MRFKKTIISLILAAGLVGLIAYDKYNRRESEIRYEDAKVVSKRYAPSHLVPPVALFPEKYDIVFDGEIDFKINNKQVYDRFKEGDLVSLSYKESSLGESKLYKFIDAQKKE